MNNNSIKVQVVGVKQVDWTNPDNNQRYQSTKCSIIYQPDADSGVSGMQVLEVRLPYEKFDKFKGKSFPCQGQLILGDFNLSKQTFKFVDIVL